MTLPLAYTLRLHAKMKVDLYKDLTCSQIRRYKSIHQPSGPEEELSRSIKHAYAHMCIHIRCVEKITFNPAQRRTDMLMTSSNKKRLNRGRKSDEAMV